MTEETTNVSQPKNMTVIYLSRGDDVPCMPLLSPEPIVTKYPLVAEAPDMTKLKNPKYDWVNKKWVESDPAAQGTQIANLQETIDSLRVDNQQLTDGKKQTDEFLKSIEKQNAQMLAMLSTVLASKIPAKPAASNSASSVPNSAASTSESVAASESTKGSEA